MTADELDGAYTALCQALGEVGEERASLLLATLCLSFMARSPDAAEVERLIAQARRLADA